MTLYVHFTHDEAKAELPYQTIAETSMRSVWNTGKRRRLMAETFETSELESVSRIINQSRRWMLETGVPMEGIKMTVKTRLIWHKLAEFCMSL